MSQISIIPKYKEQNGESCGDPVPKIYMIEGIEVVGEISPYSVAPLRILTYLLDRQRINYRVKTINGDPWQISQILLDDKYAEYVQEVLKEIMEYRCAYELGSEYAEIIRQLPFEIAMRTSQNIMNYGKTREEHLEDKKLSFQKWGEYNAMAGRYSYNNPNKSKDNVIISKDTPTLRKHLIYKSSRGGYNIKTKGYSDSTLDHYRFIDSGKWD